MKHRILFLTFILSSSIFSQSAIQVYSTTRQDIFSKIDSLVSVKNSHQIRYILDWDSTYTLKIVSGRAGLVNKINIEDRFFSKEMNATFQDIDQFLMDSLSYLQLYNVSNAGTNPYYTHDICYIKSPIEGWNGMTSLRNYKGQLSIPVCVAKAHKEGVEFIWSIFYFYVQRESIQYIDSCEIKK